MGSMTLELSDSDDTARSRLAQTFAAWELLLAEGFERTRMFGVLREGIDAAALATGVMAALQGGYLLANAAHDVQPMATALDMALDHLRSLQP